MKDRRDPVIDPMTPWRLGFWLRELVADFVSIDGHIFIDRSGEGVELLRRRVTEYETLGEAQEWMNIVLIDAFLDEAVGKDWEINDPGVDEILAVYAKAWAYQIQARFPDAGLDVQVFKDDDDVGVRLIQAIDHPRAG